MWTFVGHLFLSFCRTIHVVGAFDRFRLAGPPTVVAADHNKLDLSARRRCGPRQSGLLISLTYVPP